MFSFLANGSQRKTCSRHEKRAVPTDLWDDMARLLRQHGANGARRSLLQLDVCIDYQNIPISIPSPASHEALGNAARLIARALWELSGFRFVFHNTHEGKVGSYFYFYCAQDQDRLRPSQSTGKRAPSPGVAIHDCNGRLVVIFKSEARLVNLRIEHTSHAAYCDKTIDPQVIEYIEAHLESTPRQLYQDIMAHEELGALAKHLTQKQVWFWWRERSSGSWRLQADPFESIIASLGNSTLEEGSDPAAGARAIQQYIEQRDAENVLSPRVLGQAIKKEGSVRGYALFALGLIAKLRDRTVEISLDATFGTNSSGHDLFAVLAEVDGTGVPLMYLLLDTKDMRGDGRRIEILSQVLAMLKGMGISPLFVGCDKESAELRAIGQVWPDAKIQLCYWHVRRALRQRLGNGKATMTNHYDAYEAKATVPGLDRIHGL
ncbi:hypothetical protein CF319_g7780 [Tilletia indica]|nr:hypothetical protein CF319_g7780 [Tilletia indica]